MGQVLFAPALAGCTSDDVTASAAQVLSGYTALTKDSNDDPISGTMTNRGAWTSGSSGSGHIAIPAGYHNGSGYVDCSGAYNAGVTAADARTNTSSANYKAGYNSGRSQGQADVKANPGSYGLEAGGSYSNGYNAGKSATPVRVVCRGHINTDGGDCDFYCQVYKNGNLVYNVFYHWIGANWNDDKTF